MTSLKALFGFGIIRAGVGDRVMNKNTRELGTVIGKATIKGSITVYALNVQYDNCSLAWQISENEFIKVGSQNQY